MITKIRYSWTVLVGTLQDVIAIGAILCAAEDGIVGAKRPAAYAFRNKRLSPSVKSRSWLKEARPYSV